MRNFVSLRTVTALRSQKKGIFFWLEKQKFGSSLPTLPDRTRPFRCLIATMSDESDVESRGRYMPLVVNADDETESIPEPAPAAYVFHSPLSFHISR